MRRLNQSGLLVRLTSMFAWTSFAIALVVYTDVSPADAKFDDFVVFRSANSGVAGDKYFVKELGTVRLGPFEDIVVFGPSPDVELCFFTPDLHQKVHGDTDGVRVDGVLWSNESLVRRVLVGESEVVWYATRKFTPVDGLIQSSGWCSADILPTDHDFISNDGFAFLATERLKFVSNERSFEARQRAFAGKPQLVGGLPKSVCEEGEQSAEQRKYKIRYLDGPKFAFGFIVLMAVMMFGGAYGGRFAADFVLWSVFGLLTWMMIGWVDGIVI